MLGCVDFMAERKKKRKKKNRVKNGENRIFDGVSPVAKLRVRSIDKLDEACTNADDRMMLVRHRSGDRVMS